MRVLPQWSLAKGLVINLAVLRGVNASSGLPAKVSGMQQELLKRLCHDIVPLQTFCEPVCMLGKL